MSAFLHHILGQKSTSSWRCYWPHRIINEGKLGISVTSYKPMRRDASFYAGFDAIRFPRQIGQKDLLFLRYLKKIQKECGFKLVFDTDDLLLHDEIPPYNLCRQSFKGPESDARFLEFISLVDEVTVSTPYLRDYLRSRTGKEEVSALPNFIPYFWMGRYFDHSKVMHNFRKHLERPRIVYTGTKTHFDLGSSRAGYDDFTHITTFITKNVRKYTFVFVGSYPPRIRDYVDKGDVEVHPQQDLASYPSFLSSLEAQLFIAPLMSNRFNRSKSDIKRIEAACLGVPCLSQDIEPYAGSPQSLLFNGAEDIEHKIELLLSDEKRYAEMSFALREEAESRFLEKKENIELFLSFLTTPYGCRTRKHAIAPWT